MPDMLELQTLQCNVKNQTNVFHLRTGKVFEDRNEVEKLIIVGVREPAADGYRMLGVEDVRSWGVVDDNRFTQITANLGEVLHDSQNNARSSKWVIKNQP